MKLTIELDGFKVNVEVTFEQDEDGLTIESAKPSLDNNEDQIETYFAYELSDIDSAIWIAHAEVVKESKAP